jgi:hypothetical protein
VNKKVVSTPSHLDTRRARPSRRWCQKSTISSCPFCVTDYDTDLLLLSSETNKLPVSCRQCSYTCCYSCLQREQVRQSSSRGKVRMWLECPSCKYARGFSMENPARSIHRPFCDLLAQCRLLTAQNETDNCIQVHQMQVFDLEGDDTLVEDCPVTQGHALLPPPPGPHPLGTDRVLGDVDTSSTDHGCVSSPLAFDWLSPGPISYEGTDQY